MLFKKTKLLRAAGIISLVIIVAGLVGRFAYQQAFAPTEQPDAVTTKLDDLPGGLPEIAQTEQPSSIEVIADNLEIPWEIAWLPDGRLLVTERPGRLLMITTNRTVIPISGVAHVGEGGLQGLAVHPNFSRNNFIYLYLTTEQQGELQNRVERYRLDGDQLVDPTIIIEGIPGARIHDGGRIAFGPDGLLYVTTGDAGDETNAQNSNTLNGKILRVRDDGSIPSDNPFDNLVYSSGHRNPQGLAWDVNGQLWSTEHGRSGIQSGLDEINLITKGGNYGWPLIEGDESKTGLTAPILHSGSTVTWAPAGAAILGDTLYFAGLRGESLYEATIVGTTLTDFKAHLFQEFGRLRAVHIGSDGNIYITTSNQDGRGEPLEGDDKLIRINPAALN